ncbi:DedA family protein [Leptospira sp. 96542]|nr:DedA family protein [Leptospira sp. 96542]
MKENLESIETSIHFLKTFLQTFSKGIIGKVVVWDFLQFDSFFQWILKLPPETLWLFFCFSNCLENLFPPWPGDTVTVFSGFLAASVDPPLSIVSVALATFVGNLFGGLVMYAFGERFLNFLKHSKFPFFHKLYERENLQKTLDWFRRYQVVVILFSRFSAGIRFFVSIVAGMSKMNVIKFVFLYSIAICLWCGILLVSGYLLGQNWNQIVVILSIYNQMISGFFLLLGLVLIHQFFRKKRTKLT